MKPSKSKKIKGWLILGAGKPLDISLSHYEDKKLNLMRLFFLAQRFTGGVDTKSNTVTAVECEITYHV